MKSSKKSGFRGLFSDRLAEEAKLFEIQPFVADYGIFKDYSEDFIDNYRLFFNYLFEAAYLKEYDKAYPYLDKLCGLAYGSTQSIFPTKLYQEIFEIIVSGYDGETYPNFLDVSKSLQLKFPNSAKRIKEELGLIMDAGKEAISLAAPSLDQLYSMIAESYLAAEWQSHSAFSCDSLNEVMQEKVLLFSEKLLEFRQGKVQSEGEKLENLINKLREESDLFQSTIIRNRIKKEFKISDKEIEKLLVKDNLTSREIDSYSAKELLIEKQEISNWIYPGYVPAQGTVLLCGEAGTGKSTLAFGLLFNYLCNENFLGEKMTETHKKIENKRGLILTSDQPKNDFRQQIANNPLSWDCQENFDIINNFTASKLDKIEEKLREAQTLHRPYNMLVVDSYTSIHQDDPDYDENSVRASNTMHLFNALADKYKLAIIIIHHAKSGSSSSVADAANITIKSRGSTSIPAAASAVLQLGFPTNTDNPQANAGMRVLQIPKMRNGQQQSVLLEFDPAYYSYRLNSDALKLKEDKEKQANKILSLFADYQKEGSWVQMRYEVIAKHFKLPSGILNKALDYLIQNDLIIKIVDKAYGAKYMLQSVATSGYRVVNEVLLNQLFIQESATQSA